MYKVVLGLSVSNPIFKKSLPNSDYFLKEILTLFSIQKSNFYGNYIAITSNGRLLLIAMAKPASSICTPSQQKLWLEA